MKILRTLLNFFICDNDYIDNNVKEIIVISLENTEALCT